MIEETGGEPSAAPVNGADEDEALAGAARVRYRADGIAHIEPDERMRSALRHDEGLLALRETASIVRRSDGDSSPISGRLAITTERLVMVDELPATLASLEEVDDVTLSADRLLVLLTSETGFTIETTHPRLLRVQLAEARASRRDRHTGASSKTASGVPNDLPFR